MATAIPDRYSLEIRLGRDDDIEEWLATDTSLDRPVLVRSLGPETSSQRRSQFVESVSGAAKVSHPHLARVFAVSEVEGGAYSVSEWTGGATVADRIEASQPIELPDFLPNASGLSGALAELHESGVAHGAIDLHAISYSAAHAAKLGAFGNVPRTGKEGDVRALAAALETALTGSSPDGPPPSERIDGVPRSLDRILRSAQSGNLTAAELKMSFQAAPTPREPRPGSGAISRRLLWAAIGLVIAAIALVSIGLVFTPGGEPILPPRVTTTAFTTTTFEVATTTAGAEARIDNITTFDPFGGGGENDDSVTNLVDGDESTWWRTERYQDPLPQLKPGVGITLTTVGIPTRLEVVGLSPGTIFEVFWSDNFFAQLEQWNRVAGAQAPPGNTILDLPPRSGGFWMIWLTDLPLQPDGSYYSTMSEVRFVP